eukprot:gene8905-853_t
MDISARKYKISDSCESSLVNDHPATGSTPGVINTDLTDSETFPDVSPFDIQAKQTSSPDSVFGYEPSVGSEAIYYKYWRLSGDGEMSMRIVDFNRQTVLDQIHVFLWAGDFNRFTYLALSVKNIYENGSSNRKTKVIKRSSINSAPSVILVKNPMLSGVYHGFVKIRRAGVNLYAYTSDDEVDWNLVGSFAPSVMGNEAVFAVGLDPNTNTAQNNRARVDNIKFYGFNEFGCTSAQYYSYDSKSCKTKPVHNECGDNTWRIKYLSADPTVADQTNGYKPNYSIYTSTIVVRHRLELGYKVRKTTDQMVFMGKKLTYTSGIATIIAKVGWIASDQRVLGVGLRENLDNIEGVGPLGVYCGVPRSGNPIFWYRSSANAVHSLYTFPHTIDTANYRNYWVKILRLGDIFQCSYSTDGNTWHGYALFLYNFPATMYGGVVGLGDGYTSSYSRATDISFTGFGGVCNNRGDCKTVNGYLDKCVCISGTSGNYCERTTCSGIDSQSASVCSSHGSCVGPNQCSCQTGYSGNNCQYPSCYGKISTDSSVCSSRGSCTAYNTCSCQSGYSGSECQYPMCFGVISTNTNVCSGRGTCSAPDNCICRSDYTGPNCETPICFGSSGNSACSGSNGACVAPDTCSCNNGYTGNSCQNPVCFGVSSTSQNVCSSHGTCTSPDTCACNDGWTGENCHTPICYGLKEPIACSGLNGTCSNPNTCSCTTGYTGSNCEHNICFGIPSNETNVCSSHGNCISPDTCSCTPQYSGSKCEIPICFNLVDPSACSGENGTCTSPDTCSCSVNHGGSACEIPKCFGILATNSRVCNGKGTCNSVDVCVCGVNNAGIDCKEPVCHGISAEDTSKVCSGNGTCVSLNTCVCNNRYFGEKCEVFDCFGRLSNDTNTCSSKGKCVGKDQCYCNIGYTGSVCEFNLCNGTSSNDQHVCSSNGNCTDPDICQCKAGWIGNNCETFTCTDMNNCSGNGVCVGANTCQCNSQYSGTNCSIPICFGISADEPKVCSNRKGICESPDKCTCVTSGYSGIYCNLTVCEDVNDCSDNGLCVGANNCSCFPGWENTNCSTFNCHDVKNCSYPKGTCTGANQCECISKWSGSDCSSPICFLKSSLDKTVCSSHGNCSSPDNCLCSVGWTGNNCQFAICNGKNATKPSVCNSRGSCVQPDSCNCNTGYAGNDCEFNVCNGISSASTSVCSGHGTCSSPDNCICTSQYDGNNCQYPYCYGILSNETNSCTNNARGTCVTPNNCTCDDKFTGSQCEYDVCFGVSSGSSEVCSGNGNCTAPGECECEKGYYGENCQKSDLEDFVDSLCNTNCTLNRNKLRNCTKSGVSCYCNGELNDGNIFIACDEMNRITDLKFNNLSFTGNLPSMKNFSALKSLDLSKNEVKSIHPLSTFLPSSLQNLNLSENSIQNSASNYVLPAESFPLIQSVTLDSNRMCGIFPANWITSSFELSVNDHQKTIWCSDINSIVCGPLNLNKQTYTLLPYENSLTLNYTTSVHNECKNFLESGKLRCQSRVSNNKTQFQFTTSDISQNTVQCSRNGLYSDIDQFMSFAWRYNSTLVERISTEIHVVNLPYAKILQTDPHLIQANVSGIFEMKIYSNQNISRYRKNTGDKIYCGISSGLNEYWVEATTIQNQFNAVSCMINIEGKKQTSVSLFESSKQQKISSLPFHFWFINTKISISEITSNLDQHISFTDLEGNLINGYDHYNYSLSNTLNGINIPCNFSGGKIQYCKKSKVISLSKNINEIELDFEDGITRISKLNSIFYEKNVIQFVSPKAILLNQVEDIIITFNKSTLETDLIDINYFCVDTNLNINFTATKINSTTLKCNSVSAGHSIKFKFDIYATYKKYKMIISLEKIEFQVIQQNFIFPSSSITSMNGSKTIEFSFMESISSTVSSSLECELSDRRVISADYVSSQDFKCTFDSQVHQNMTFWYRNELGSRIRLSSNSIPLYFFKFSDIGFTVESKQLASTVLEFNPIIKLLDSNIPKEYVSQVSCFFNGTLVKTVLQNETNAFKCSISSITPGFHKIGLRFRKRNSYKVANLQNTFYHRVNMSYYFPNPLIDSFGLKTYLNTQKYISEGIMKENCDDLVVTFRGREIERLVENCNSSNTVIQYKIQEIQNGSISDYQIYFGNDQAIAKSLGQIGVSYSTTPKHILDGDETILILNNNQLDLGFVETFTINNIVPFAGLASNSTVSLSTNYDYFDYEGKVKFIVKYDGKEAHANYSLSNSTSVFTSTIVGTESKRIQISIHVVYLTTGESIQVSGNSVDYVFVDSVNLESITPFIDRFSFENEEKNSTLNIKIKQNFLTDYGLKCKYNHKGVTKYSDATLLEGSLTTISCSIEILNLTENAEFVIIELFMQVSNNQYQNFILSEHNMTYVFLKEPVHFNIPKTITQESLNQEFELNFENGLANGRYFVSFDNYKVKLKPQYVAENPERYISCNFDKLIPNCQINNISLSHTPMQLNYELEVSRNNGMEKEVFAITSNYFRENISFVSELPFIVDVSAHQNSLANISFTLDKKLNDGFSFYCKIFDEMKPIERDSQELNIFKCGFLTREMEENVTISIILGNSSIEGMNSVISTEESIIQAVSLKLSPEFSTIPKKETLEIIKGDSFTFQIPEKYVDYMFYLISEHGQSFSCLVQNQSLNCMKTSLLLNSQNDIFMTKFKLKYSVGSFVDDLVSLNQGLVIYKNSEISTVFPLAALVGDKVNITLTFGERTMKSFGISNLQFFCEFGNSSVGSKKDESSLICPVSYEDHFTKIIQFQSYFIAPEYAGNKKIYITNQKSNANFHYLTTNEISFADSNQLKFYYTSSPTNLKILISTFIPANLTKYMITKLSDSSGFSSSTNLSSTNGDSFIFNSLVSTPVGGKKKLSLWYKEKDYQFQLSNNTVDLVFATPSLITGLAPTAIILNRSTEVTISTTFPTNIDYGKNVSFSCKYGTNESVYAYNTSATLDANIGNFGCNILYSEEAKLFISIWMNVDGSERKITVVDEPLLVIDSNFFTPSIGKLTGGENVTIVEYTDSKTNITFIDPSLDGKYEFICEKINTSLSCKAPVVSNQDVSIFDSYPLKFTLISKNLSVPFIYYDNREVKDFHPRVVSSTSLNFLFNFTINKKVTIQTGGLFLVFSPDTNERKDINLGTISGKDQLTKMISLFENEQSGIFEFQLFYYNIYSVEFRSMFAISSKQNLTFTGKSEIELTSETNLFKINSKRNVTIKFTDVGKLYLSDEEKKSVQCKMDTDFVLTRMISSDEFICEIESSIAQISKLSIYYVNQNAFGNEILLSINEINFIFIDGITIESILPFSSISANQPIQLSSQYTNIYGSSVAFKCVAGSIVSDATLINGVFSCNLDKILPGSYSLNVTIAIQSTLKGTSLIFSKNTEVFYFLNQIELLSISSHAETFTTSTHIKRTVNLKLKDDLITIKNGYCKYTSSEGTGFSKAEFSNDSKRDIKCDIEKTNFSNLVEIVDVEFSNNQSFLFIKDEISWNSKKVVDKNSLRAELNFNVPLRRYFEFEMKMVSDVPLEKETSISCNFVLGTKVNCNLPESYLNSLKYVPTKLNFVLTVIHKYTLQRLDVIIDHLFYKRETQFQHMKPHYISYNERLNYPLRLIGNTFLSLNSSAYQYICNITQGSLSIAVPATFDVQSNEFQPNLNQSSHFICTFNSFGIKNKNYKISLSVETVDGTKLITTNSSTIYVFEKPFDLPIFYASNKGGYEIGKINYFNQLPTSTYSDYKLSLKLEDRNQEYPIKESTFIDGGFVFTMIDISKYYKTWDVVEKRIKLNLYINSIRSISFLPQFTFYQITVESISPSTWVRLNSKSVLHFKIKELLNQREPIYVKYVNDFGENEQETCDVKPGNILSCLSPSFSKGKSMRVYFSIKFAGDSDSGKTLQLYDDNSYSYFRVLPNEVSPYSMENVYLVGNFSKTAAQVKIKYSNIRNIEEVVDAICWNETHIIGKSPSYYLTTLNSAQVSIKIAVSIDNGVFYHDTNLSLSMTSVEMISFLPSKVPEGLDFSLELIDLPPIQSNNVSLRLISDSSTIHLNCDEFRKFCKPLSLGSIKTGSYELVVLIGTDIANLVGNKFIVYEIPTFTDVLPATLYQEMKSPISIKGSKFLMDNSITLLIKYTSAVFGSSISSNLTASTDVNNDREIKISIPKIADNITTVDISISFNDGKYYHFIKTMNVIPNPILEIIKNQNSLLKDSTGFSFRNSKLHLIGSNFFDDVNQKPIFKVQSQLATMIWRGLNNPYRFISSNLIEFDLPSIEIFNITESLKYPVSFQFGISFNNEYDFIQRELLYLDKYTTLFLFQINPSIIPKTSQFLSIQGIGFEYVDRCQIKSGDKILFESNVTKTEVSDIIGCNITTDSFLQGSIKNITVYVLNVFNDTSNGFLVKIYENPMPTRFTFSEGATIGGYDLGVFVDGLNENTVFCKFGNINCDVPCKKINSSFISCHINSYPTGTFPFYIGYNNIDWISNNELNFTFIPCGVGETADNYSSNCYPCPKGTYKLTSGLYACQSCPINTYQNSTGSLSCISCPERTVSALRSPSRDDCVCDIGYYINPSNPKDCLQCPVGGICAEKNLSVPVAKYGYWFSKNDINSFYSCNPRESCGGGDQNNCTEKYTGIRCGYCKVNYYKSKNICYACEGINIMEYIMLIATLMTLFFGLLFLSSRFQTNGIRIFIEIVSFAIIVSSNILAIIMTFWDIYTRRKNIGKRAKKEKRDTKNLSFKTPKEKEYDFHYNWRKWDVSSEEDSKLTMNQIFENLLSFKRFQRKGYLIIRKGKRVGKKLIKAKNAVEEVVPTKRKPTVIRNIQLNQVKGITEEELLI